MFTACSKFGHPEDGDCGRTLVVPKTNIVNVLGCSADVHVKGTVDVHCTHVHHRDVLKTDIMDLQWAPGNGFPCEGHSRHPQEVGGHCNHSISLK